MSARLVLSLFPHSQRGSVLVSPLMHTPPQPKTVTLSRVSPPLFLEVHLEFENARGHRRTLSDWIGRCGFLSPAVRCRNPGSLHALASPGRLPAGSLLARWTRCAGSQWISTPQGLSRCSRRHRICTFCRFCPADMCPSRKFSPPWIYGESRPADSLPAQKTTLLLEKWTYIRPVFATTPSCPWPSCRGGELPSDSRAFFSPGPPALW